MTDLRFDIGSLRQAYAAGLTPAEVIEAVFGRIAAANDPGIFIHLRDKAAPLAEAAALGSFDADKPLWGIPFAVKDNIDVAGMPTTAACPAYQYYPTADATVVALLRAAGAIPIGKTNPDQFATGPGGRARRPTPIPGGSQRHRSELSPGGSTSGSAVAVARGVVSFSLGTDTGTGLHGPGGTQQHRGPQALGRRTVDDRSRPRLPDARLRLGVRADGGGRRPSQCSGAARAGRHRCLFAQLCTGTLGMRLPCCASMRRAPPIGNSSATAMDEAAYDAGG